MLKFRSLLVCLTAFFASAAFASVNVSSPSNGGSYSGPVQFTASGTTTTCSKGVGSMGIYTAPGVLSYVENGSSLNTQLSLNPATYGIVVTEWDNCGRSTTASLTITVKAGGSSGV